MKHIQTRLFGTACLCLMAIATSAVASAQTVRHDIMDAQAARRDIRRLERDLDRARWYHNWGKVAQDERLIATDRYFVKKDIRKARYGG